MRLSLSLSAMRGCAWPPFALGRLPGHVCLVWLCFFVLRLPNSFQSPFSLFCLVLSLSLSLSSLHPSPFFGPSYCPVRHGSSRSRRITSRNSPNAICRDVPSSSSRRHRRRLVVRSSIRPDIHSLCSRRAIVFLFRIFFSPSIFPLTVFFPGREGWRIIRLHASLLGVTRLDFQGLLRRAAVWEDCG